MIESVNILHPGDRVRIVSEWNGNCQQNSEGRMDHWLGSIMTVRSVSGGFAHMEEDVNDRGKHIGWAWNKFCIDEVLPPDFDEIDPVADDAYMSVLMS